ncbi:protein phosphatase 2C [Cryptosporidium canis]|uniref:Protein phosphatase 2C n=1 Tax=Cryptosporidium canis TaxID=195482 RepID=A0ABQ8PE91_9CRYT|nr:protein phosphatase 2C [Cryptosporidium canis]KAJ1615299.1 protein phosphatase 2C [Cryptosporidium canis]
MYNQPNQNISYKGGLTLSGGYLSSIHSKTSIPSPSYIIGPSKQSATINGWARLNSSLGPQLTNLASFIHRRAGRISRSPSPVRGIGASGIHGSGFELKHEKSPKEFLDQSFKLEKKSDKYNSLVASRSASNGIRAAKQIGESVICNEKSVYEENRELKKQISELKEAIMFKEGENLMLRSKLELLQKEIISFSNVSMKGRESLPPLKVKAKCNKNTVRELDNDIFDLYICGDCSSDEKEVFSKKKCIWKPNKEFAISILEQLEISFACVKGKRVNKTMVNQDDFFIARLNNSLIIGVFDGHGRYGHKVAAIVKQRIMKGIQNIVSGELCQLEEGGQIIDISCNKSINVLQKTSQENIIASISKIFDGIQNYLEKEGSFGASGTSVTFAMMRSDKITMVQLGSSGGVVIDSNSGDIIYTTPRHDLSNIQEKERVVRNGAIINENHRFSLNRAEPKPLLFSLTRSLGDSDGKAMGISNKPEVWEMSIDRESPIKVILATDGFLKYSDEMRIDQSKLCIQKELDLAVKKCQHFWLNSTENTSVDDITIVSCNVSNLFK